MTKSHDPNLVPVQASNGKPHDPNSLHYKDQYKVMHVDTVENFLPVGNRIQLYGCMCSPL